MTATTATRKPRRPLRTAAVLLKLTVDEKAALTAKARKAKKPRAVFIRDAALAA